MSFGLVVCVWASAGLEAAPPRRPGIITNTVQFESALRAEPAMAAAVDHLQRSISVDPRGEFAHRLASLRDRRDAQLRPLFEHLLAAANFHMQRHALLALAELSEPARVDLNQLLAVRDLKDRRQLVTACLDRNQMSLAQCRTVLNWEWPDALTRAYLAIPLVKSGKLTAREKALLRKGLEDRTTIVRGVSALVLLQAGDGAASHVLDAYLPSRRSAAGKHSLTEPDADIRYLIQNVRFVDLDAAGPWAVALSGEADLAASTRLMAVNLALVLNAARAKECWRLAWDRADGDAAQRTRLALMLLAEARNIQPSWTQPLLDDDRQLIRDIGVAARAIAEDGDLEPLRKMIKHRHAPSIDLANLHAQRIIDSKAQATAQQKRQAESVLQQIILMTAPPAGRHLGLDEHALALGRKATWGLRHGDKQRSQAFLRGLLLDDKTHAAVKLAVLMGLEQAPGDSLAVIKGMPEPLDATLRMSLLMLRAERGAKLSEDEMAQLGLLVRGAGQLASSLRTRAGWAYLKQRGVGALAVEHVIARVDR